jgi:hypothetical protein
VAQSNAERQRNHKERLKQKAAEGVALAELMLENQRAIGEYITRLERVVLHAEGQATEHPRPEGMLSLPSEEVERLARMKEFRSVSEGGSTKPATVFLGMSAQQWTTMPRELLEVFGLTGMAAEWHPQANESITDDNERQPETVDIEVHPAQASSPESEEDFPLPEITEGSWMPPVELASPRAPEPLDFQSFFEAYRQWLDDCCLHPARTPERQAWAQENLFPYDGTLWKYVAKPENIPAPSWRLRYDSEDGRTLTQPV